MKFILQECIMDIGHSPQTCLSDDVRLFEKSPFHKIICFREEIMFKFKRKLLTIIFCLSPVISYAAAADKTICFALVSPDNPSLTAYEYRLSYSNLFDGRVLFHGEGCYSYKDQQGNVQYDCTPTVGSSIIHDDLMEVALFAGEFNQKDYPVDIFNSRTTHMSVNMDTLETVYASANVRYKGDKPDVPVEFFTTGLAKVSECSQKASDRKANNKKFEKFIKRIDKLG